MPSVCSSCFFCQECYIFGLEKLYTKNNSLKRKGIDVAKWQEYLTEEWKERLAHELGCVWDRESLPFFSDPVFGPERLKVCEDGYIADNKKVKDARDLH